jgi:DsbC/DsbD-like thiol-disulfide interchange protein
MMTIMTAPWRPACAAVAAVFFLADAAQADDASPWSRDRYAAVRIVAGSRTEGGGNVLIGGIEIELQPGWKTYWRTPGDSGVPPQFDFSKSENLESATVLWPAPEKFSDGASGISYGYRAGVVLPLRIVPKNPAKPVRLQAHIQYAVCEKICVPIDAAAALTFTDALSSHDAALRAALERVPRPVRAGDDTPVALRSITATAGAKPRLQIEIAAPADTRVDLFAEGPSADWSLPVPAENGHSRDGAQRFAFELDGVPSGTDPRAAALRLTAVSKNGAYEFTVPLAGVLR